MDKTFPFLPAGFQFYPVALPDKTEFIRLLWITQ
jgi:hypothetical protein